MNVNKMIVIALVALMSVPAAAYASQYSDVKAGQRLVEGHTSYAVMQKPTSICDYGQPCPPQKEEGTAVAVLTSEKACVYDTTDKLNGVLWFNDQFLVGDDDGAGAGPVCTVRYPCGGMVYATSAGLPDPFSGLIKPGSPAVLTSTQYQESYKITDPNDKVWIIDLWAVPLGTTSVPPVVVSQYVWTVNILGGVAATTETTPDSGLVNCAPYTDTARHSADPNPSTYADPHCAARAAANSTYTTPPPCAAMGNSTNPINGLYPTITYNALLFMRFNHLVDSGDVEYGVNGTNSGESTIDGNSHPWNDGPTKANAAAKHTHDTANVDIRYTFGARPQPGVTASSGCKAGAGLVFDPVSSRCLWVDDTVGSSAPFDTHP